MARKQKTRQQQQQQQQQEQQGRLDEREERIREENHDTLGGDSFQPGDEQNHTGEEVDKNSLTFRWAMFVEGTIKAPWVRLIVKLGVGSAKYPLRVALFFPIFSIFCIIAGFGTNFYVESQEHALWTPQTSHAYIQGTWARDESGFPENRLVSVLLHKNGENVLSLDGAKLLFQINSAITGVPGYDEVCDISPKWYKRSYDGGNTTTCILRSITSFYNNNYETFQENATTFDDFIETVSGSEYPSGEPVDRSAIYGLSEVNNVTGLLDSAQALRIVLVLPQDGETLDDSLAYALEKPMGVVLGEFRDNVNSGNTGWVMEIITTRGFEEEFVRGIIADLPLIPAAFVIMSLFCCFVFSKRNRVESRSLLGVGAVVSVLLAVITSYGIMFIGGVPFTSLTQILPFVIFGIGLDDAFIIMGSYSRTDPNKETVARIEETMKDIGGSILITSLTSGTAFGLGALSSIPAIRWLCIYAFPTIIIDFLYQITFFVSLIVLDERRIKANKIDCCICITSTANDDDDEDEDDHRRGRIVSGLQDRSAEKPEEAEEERQLHFSENIMRSLAGKLVNPAISSGICLIFFLFLVINTFNALELTVAFDLTDALPGDSYIIDFVDASTEYGGESVYLPFLFFRDVDFGDPEVRKSMHEYVDQMTDLDFVSGPPTFFWLRDFELFTSLDETLAVMTFRHQLDAFLSIEIYDQLHGSNIVRDEEGNMIASRCRILMGGVSPNSVTTQVHALKTQRAITMNFPINEGLGPAEHKFFSFVQAYNIWEFFSVAEYELVLTTLVSVISVSLISVLFIPHWSAVFFVAPFVCMLYVDMLGTLQLAGLHINAITYVGVVMAIGLMVDYLMHIVIRYYESLQTTRRTKVIDTLETMGASVFVGGITTMLGVMLMSFASSEIFYTMFVGFIALVTLGVGHGLLFLPVVLLIVGPSDSVVAQIFHQQHQENSKIGVPVSGSIEFTTSSSSSSSSVSPKSKTRTRTRTRL